MKKKMLAFLMAVLIVVGIFPVTAMADGGGNVAKIVSTSTSTSTEYPTLQAAVNAAESGATITLLDDLKDVGDVNLPANGTLDGDGHKISGNSAIYINAVGGTVQNVNFESIHNDISISESEKTKYSLTRTAGKLTAIYGNQLSGKATITGCTFDKIDWDAIQITPVAGAEVRITGNTFKHTKDESAIRYVHIQSGKNVNFAATVTGNKFLNCDKLAETGIEVYYPTDGEKVDCSGNYMDAPMGVCIGTGTSFNNAYDKAFKFKDENLANDVDIAITVYDPAGNTYFYPTEKDAIEAGVVAKIDNMGYKTLAKAVAAAKTNETVELVKDVTLTARVDTNFTGTIDLNGKTVSSTATCANGSVFNVVSGTVEIKNGKMVGIAGPTGLAAPYDNECDVITVRSNAVANLDALDISINSITGACAYAFDGGTINVKSGTYTNSATGTYANDKQMLLNQADNKAQLIFVSGGTFVGANPALGDNSGNPATFLKEGYFSKADGTGKWQVKPMEVVVKPAVVDEQNNITVGETNVTVTGTDVNGGDKPTAEQAANAITETLYTEAFFNYEDPNIAGAVTGEGTVKMSIVPKAATVVNDSGVVITGMTFEVHPENGEKQKIDNNNIKKSITFRLPVDSKVTATTVAVYHNGVLMGTYPIHSVIIGGTGTTTVYEKYIEVQSKEFSTFAYELLNATNSTAKTDDGKYYATLANAIEKASGKTVTIIKDTNEVVTVERAMSFELEVANGVNFNGAIRPGDDYVRHIYGDKYYFELYEAGDTIVIGGNRNKDAKADTAKEENPETGAPVMNMGVLAVLAVAYVATRKH